MNKSYEKEKTKCETLKMSIKQPSSQYDMENGVLKTPRLEAMMSNIYHVHISYTFI